MSLFCCTVLPRVSSIAEGWLQNLVNFCSLRDMPPRLHLLVNVELCEVNFSWCEPLFAESCIELPKLYAENAEFLLLSLDVELCFSYSNLLFDVGLGCWAVFG